MDAQLQNLHSAAKLEELFARRPRGVDLRAITKLRNFLIHTVWEGSNEVESELSSLYKKLPKSLRQAMMSKEFCKRLHAYSQLPQAKNFEKRQLYLYAFIRMLSESREILYEGSNEEKRSALLDQQLSYRKCISALKTMCDWDEAKERNRARNRLHRIVHKRHEKKVKSILNSDLSEVETNEQLLQELGSVPKGYNTWIEYALAQKQRPEGIGHWGQMLHMMNSCFLKFRSDNDPIVECALMLTLFPDLLQLPQAVLRVCQYDKDALQDTGDICEETIAYLHNLIREIKQSAFEELEQDFSELDIGQQRNLITKFLYKLDPAPASVLELLDGLNALSITPTEQENGGRSAESLDGADVHGGPSTASK
eukprot:TRINITY_DN459_c0_g1_i1.p1 TRINITY_DN459_c0_g1~~TRINITY_DN459_c0_g1_i1.p1  ORF type:complete len:367 (+),score=67.50 TRINITY_DN459_c0_g1_i1:85-1185(+)